MIIIGKKAESNVVVPISLYYDFDQPGWLEYPMFGLKDPSVNTAFQSISLAKVMEKKSAKIYACITLVQYDPDLLDFLAYISIQSYDLSYQQYGQWKVLQTYQVPKYQKRYPTIYSFKGELYFTDPLHGIPGYMIQKSILDDKTEEEPKYLVSAIPYISYE